MAVRALTNTSPTSPRSALVSSITSLLRNLNPQKANPSDLSFAPLNQFSCALDPSLVIEVIKKQTNPYHALFFFNWASNPAPNPNGYSHTHHCYLAIIDLLLSHSLFSTASSLLIQSNRLSDFMIAKFIKAHGDRADIRAAIDWLHRAKVIENGRCLFSYNAILGVLVRTNRIHFAESLYNQIVNEGVVKPDVSTYTTMIRGYCKMGMIENAKKVFDEMGCEPNLITYNTMIFGYCKKGDMESARRILGYMMDSKDCLPDTVTYTTLIDGYCKKGELDDAAKFMDEMEKQGCEPNMLTYNALVHGLCLSGKVDEAKRMMTRMRLNGVKDNIATHTSILRGLCIVGKLDEAIQHIKEMVRIGIKLDVKSYGVVVNEYCERGKPDEAISLLKEMRSKGLNPSVSSFNAVFRILVENGELEKAVHLLKQMPEMGCSPNFVSYNTVIHGLCGRRGRMQEVQKLIRHMVQNGHELDATVCSLMVKGYCEDANVNRAVQVFYEALDKHYIINLESFSVLIKELCRKGQFHEAEIIVEEMCRRCNVIDIDSYRKVMDDFLCLYSGKTSETTFIGNKMETTNLS
ncbi:hypothetical protein FEM48_Zijuj06G0056800 [Ziziphus jujuba var. spinosa]|uniref:Uncharacterized protein n=1 Tax=Ziziphus jujuba var. spinosa TaxID=714518 RepID=A0A978V7H5_ZIZJJ|nr:pentatricopeptide repeat-containing protein At4g11690-like [Ziziphus jujuba var. spinosa]KAH7523860.1 hypothetical protein FEM48_Zijuj06G0056800 [Ziziphus jujuba var. spinosa]